MNNENLDKIASLPSQMCRDHKVQGLACHVTHPQQQSQKFDSKLDPSSHSQPKIKTKYGSKKPQASLIKDN